MINTGQLKKIEVPSKILAKSQINPNTSQNNLINSNKTKELSQILETKEERKGFGY